MSFSEKMRDDVPDSHRKRRNGGRPTSNNRDVEYDGDSFFFTWEQSRSVTNMERDPKVAPRTQEARA